MSRFQRLQFGWQGSVPVVGGLRLLHWLPAALAVVAALALTWVFTVQPWSLRVTVGGADSALLGPGFYTREVTADGVPFRWTNGPATFRVPYLRSAAIISLRADTATGQPYTVKLLDGQRRWATFEAQPGFRNYQVLWPSPLGKVGPAGLSARDFTVLADARTLRENDNRLYGIAISGFAARDLTADMPLPPLLVVTLALLGLLSVLWPLAGRRRIVFVLVALGLAPLYTVLAWHPPTSDFTWLPLSWLPWFVALALLGLALVRLTQAGRRGALAACFVTGGVFALLLWSLHAHWLVDGPDYAWHLNHGGSWARVFRAHRFYPFGFPLILYLGQLAGDQPLLFGRITGAVATLTLFGATVALAWRLYGHALAWLGGALLLGAPIVIAYGTLASTDAPMAACAALALLALCWSPVVTWRAATIGGALLGLGYLFRFQAIVLLVPVGVWLLLVGSGDAETRRQGDRVTRRQEDKKTRRQEDDKDSNTSEPLKKRRFFAPGSWLLAPGSWLLPLVLVGSFVLATSPQWLLDIRDFGRPFFTAQYVNIWTFGYGKQEGLPEGSAAAQLWYILNYDPSLLWRHWADNLRQAGFETLNGALVWPFGVLALIGAGVGLLSLRDRRQLLLALWVASYVAVVALTYNKERFFLPVMPALVVFVVALAHALGERFAAGHWRTGIITTVSVMIWCWAMLHLLDAQRELILYLR